MARGRKKANAESKSEAQKSEVLQEESAEQFEKKTLDSADFELDLNTATLAELAEIAQHYSDRSYETLRRLTRGELLNIIKNESDTRDKSYNGLDKDADNLLKMFVEILDEIKRARESAPLNPTLKRIFISQNNKLTEVLVNANIKSGIISISILLILSLALFIDAFIGFNSIVKRIKERAKTKNKENVGNNSDSNQMQNGLANV